MDLITVNRVSFSGIVNVGATDAITERLQNTSCEFALGRVYIADSDLGGGGWALSWIVGGVLEPDQGVITRNGVLYEAQQRRQDAWCVRRSIATEIPGKKPTVRTQIQYGLATVADQYMRSETEVIEKFHLTPERYNRPLASLSKEAWRASCAIGLVNGRRIFCFPYLDVDFVETNYKLWLRDLIDLLREAGALIVIPTRMTAISTSLCDEVVPIA